MLVLSSIKSCLQPSWSCAEHATVIRSYQGATRREPSVETCRRLRTEEGEIPLSPFGHLLRLWRPVSDSSQPVEYFGTQNVEFRRRTNWHVLPKRNFKPWFETNRALFWGNNLEPVLVMKNTFQQYTIYLCLVLFENSHIFLDKLWKMSV